MNDSSMRLAHSPTFHRLLFTFCAGVRLRNVFFGVILERAKRKKKLKSGKQHQFVKNVKNEEVSNKGKHAEESRVEASLSRFGRRRRLLIHCHTHCPPQKSCACSLIQAKTSDPFSSSSSIFFSWVFFWPFVDARAKPTRALQEFELQSPKRHRIHR